MRGADAVLNAVLASLDRREAVALATVVAGSGDCTELVGRHLVLWRDPAQPPVGDLGLDRAQTAQVIADARQALTERRSRQVRYATDTGEFTLFVDVQAQPPHLIVVGAGHVAAPLAAIAHICEFTVTVLDDRPQFAKSLCNLQLAIASSSVARWASIFSCVRCIFGRMVSSGLSLIVVSLLKWGEREIDRGFGG